MNSKEESEEEGEEVEEDDESSDSDSNNKSSLPLFGLGKRTQGKNSPDWNNKCARILSPYTE